MSKIKHSKYKNTGIIFELLARQATADTLAGKNTQAFNIIKKHFKNSEIGKEFKLYNFLTHKNNLSENKADIVISTLLESSKKLNRQTLKREKFNLIKEIKKHYNLNDFFKIQLPNYKLYASFYNLLEIYNDNQIFDPSHIINYKTTLLEYLTSKTINKQEVEDNLIKEFKTYDKDLRLLVYQVLLEDFNSKYDNFYDSQKQILREIINLNNSSYSLNKFYNEKILELKRELTPLIQSVSNETTKIKLQEIFKFLQEADSSVKIKDTHLTNILHFYFLLEELKKVNG